MVAIIEDDDEASDSVAPIADDSALVVPASPSVPPTLSPFNFGDNFGHLDSLSRLVEHLLPSAPIEASMNHPPCPVDTALPNSDDSLSDSPPT